MRIKLRVTVTPGSEPVEVITNLLCIAEWERTEGRKVSDGRGIGTVSYTHLTLPTKA